MSAESVSELYARIHELEALFKKVQEDQKAAEAMAEEAEAKMVAAQNEVPDAKLVSRVEELEKQLAESLQNSQPIVVAQGNKDEIKDLKALVLELSGKLAAVPSKDQLTSLRRQIKKLQEEKVDLQNKLNGRAALDCGCKLVDLDCSGCTNNPRHVELPTEEQLQRILDRVYEKMEKNAAEIEAEIAEIDNL